MDLECVTGVEAIAFVVLDNHIQCSQETPPLPYPERDKRPLDHLHVLLFPFSTNNNNKKKHLILWMKHTLVKDNNK